MAGPGPAGRGDDGVGSPGAALHHLPQPRRPGPQARHQGPGEGVESKMCSRLIYFGDGIISIEVKFKVHVLNVILKVEVIKSLYNLVSVSANAFKHQHKNIKGFNRDSNLYIDI